jgi:hypothetical protein
MYIIIIILKVFHVSFYVQWHQYYDWHNLNMAVSVLKTRKSLLFVLSTNTENGIFMPKRRLLQK